MHAPWVSRDRNWVLIPIPNMRGHKVHNNKIGVTWAVSPDVRATQSPDGCVLLDIETGQCYRLNVVGYTHVANHRSKPNGNYC